MSAFTQKHDHSDRPAFDDLSGGTLNVDFTVTLLIHLEMMGAKVGRVTGPGNEMMGAKVGRVTDDGGGSQTAAGLGHEVIVTEGEVPSEILSL